MAYTAPTNVDRNGNILAFGFNSAYAPSALTSAGFLARAVSTSDSEPEVFQTATNGEGLVEAVAIAKPANKMLKITISGYVTDAFDKSTFPNTFTFLGRFFFVTKVSDPVPKGVFIEVSLDCSSFPLVTS